ncbi:hypothetical protein ZJ96_004533 [Salmonella enterica subsp. enterica]|nr:hypothetical protein [Salmonella enterica subsp. enterica serovar Hvittingfoss]EDQ2854357.1 hypothetical protein [Salmonella enterica subsp. enterica]EDQ3161190.1 hypothetical protein [Salmonella enterica subsp. enterica serovar Singapore]EDR5814864.1 hypothetical protein [Salmonella enterica subsp. enterica serovar Soumbedioune]EDV1374042.1 hypothetical protein [Salmonella enterica subsp. enterica serovar Sundsvall]
MGAVQVNLKKLLGAFCFLPHNPATNHLHVMRQKASSAIAIIPHTVIA